MKLSSNKILFRLSARHSYFDMVESNCIQFLPGEITKSLQRRFGFKIKKGIGSVEVYTDHVGTIKNYFDYIKEVACQDHFDFKIITNSQLFWSVTEMPLKWLGQFNYDSKLSTQIQGDGRIILKPTLVDEICSEIQGNVNIRFDDVVNDLDKELFFNIEFKARSTQWNYYVVNRSKVKLNSPGITEKNSAVSFSGPEVVLTPDGFNALKFSTGTNLLPLSDVPKYKFDLIDKVQGTLSSAKLICRGLPTPNPVRTTIVQVNGKDELASPMYIYI